MSLKKLAVALAASAAALAANASVVSSSTALVLETTEINQTHNFNLFDAALGTLNSVTITLDTLITSEGSITNTAAQGQNFRFVSSAEFFLSGFGSLLAATDPATLLSYDNRFGTALGALESVTLSPVSVDGSLSFTITDTSAFIGTGSFALQCTTQNSNTFTGGGGNLVTDLTTLAGCGLTVAYDYTEAPDNEVPEPASMALLGLAALGAAAATRRRRNGQGS